MLTDIFTTSNKYSIIYADPPWQFKTYSDKGKGRSADCHYPTMSKGEIQNLPIQNIAAKDSILFLWVTAPCLIEGIELISAWGFTYKTVAFTWIKQNKKQTAFSKGWDIIHVQMLNIAYWQHAEWCLTGSRVQYLR